MEPETCENCQHNIGRLETAYLWQDRVVCAECYRKLISEAEPPASPAAGSFRPATALNAAKPQGERVLFSKHPAMFRNHPIEFILCLLLSVVGVGLVILLFWWLSCLNRELRITNQRTILRHGILSKHTNEVCHADVRNIRVHQGFFQRLLGVGGLEVSSAGQAGIEIAVDGITEVTKAADLIRQYRQ